MDLGRSVLILWPELWLVFSLPAPPWHWSQELFVVNIQHTKLHVRGSLPEAYLGHLRHSFGRWKSRCGRNGIQKPSLASPTPDTPLLLIQIFQYL